MSVKFNFALDLLLLFLIRREKSEFGRQMKVASLGVKGVHPRYFVKLVFEIAVADKLGPLSRLLRGSKPQPPTGVGWEGEGVHPDFFVKLDLEIAVVQQTSARDRTFEGVPDSACPQDSHAHIWLIFAKLCQITLTYPKPILSVVYL